MDNIELLKKVAKDIANIQHNSDVLSQWPINSVTAMYYSGPFFAPMILKNIKSWGDNVQQLFEERIFPSKLANIVFYLLNDKLKELVGKENHNKLLNSLMYKITLYKTNSFLQDYKSPTWIPNEFRTNKLEEKTDLRKLVFLLDNLTEVVNPIFRGFGTQLFFDETNVYRYYYRTGLNFGLIIISPKEGMEIDFFEHIVEPENLEESKAYIYQENKINLINVETLTKTVETKLNELTNSNTFDKYYVINQIYDAFGYNVPSEQMKFLETPFPKEVEDFYIKTCKLPTEMLEKGIQKALGVIE